MIKGISLEVRNHIKSEHLKKWASYIHLATFLMCITVLVFFLCIFLWVVVLDHENSISISLLILIVSILSAFILYRPETVSQIKKIIQTRKTFNYVRDLLRDLQNILTIPFALAIMITISLIIWLIVFQPVLHSPLQGHVTVDMDSICYKDGAPIPVLIQVTGPNNGLSIYLSREEAENNLTQIDLINYLKPEHSGKRMVSGNNNSILSGNSLGGGRYSVFINTTNLTREYYEIKSVRPKYTKKYGLKGFYLLNNS
ncbi:hypothetical protein DRN85_04210 [Methanosarcinales archaeon]|nr:MAG: hypothetical protein DRN85_04210 [Methanosarcinales archaeon]